MVIPCVFHLFFYCDMAMKFWLWVKHIFGDFIIASPDSIIAFLKIMQSSN